MLARRDSHVNTRCVISVIVPAHNEEAVIGRLLRRVMTGAWPGEFEFIVVPNGCTDGTGRVAESFGPPVRVVPLRTAGKYAALRAGDAEATGDAVVYVDADVEIGAKDLRALAAALRQPGVLVVAPERVVRSHRSSWLVRWYYDLWQQLPGVQEGLFGRGVIALSSDARRRLLALPEVMGDDLAASVAFAAEERRVVPDAQVVVHAPRTLPDLVRRRVRSVTATAQLQRTVSFDVESARTSRADLLGIVARRPTMAPKLAAFLAVTAAARWLARRPVRAGDFATWLRDESSRAA
jgi:glycosyltransferase involved in cell wall biosynthesis